MKKAKLLAALLCSASILTGNLASAVPAMADSMKVVTLGADLSQAQKDTMMKYFKVSSSEVQILTVTNQDERDHLSAYVPLEQIGTRTVSCAYVKPTTSGGIKVRTANLNWVTCNMIATTLSTSGVTNCEVVAACPFEVSGTGALTGIQMAYETASGQKLDETKKQIATEEMVVTGNLADQVGQNDATTVINQAKMQVIADNIQNADEIYNIVVNAADANGVYISEDQINTIVSLLREIAEQNYDYSEMQETLERVNDNVTGQAEITDDTDNPDSIISDLDESVLGEDVVASSTEDPSLSETSEAGQAEVEGSGTDEIPEATGDEISGSEEEDTDVSEMNTDFLSEESKALFEKAKTFCKGEYEGDTAALQEAMGEDAYCDVTMLDSENGKELSNAVLKKYLEILGNGTSSYVPDGDEEYLTVELNMLKKDLKKIFGIDVTEEEKSEKGVGILDELLSPDDRYTLYNDTMKFFEKLYGESYDSYDENAGSATAGAAEAPVDDSMLDDSYTEEDADITEETIEETGDMDEIVEE